MLQPKPHSPAPVPPVPSRASAQAARSARRPFLGALDTVLVDDRGEFVFDGAVKYGEANAVWTWLSRDVAPDLIGPLDAQAEQGDGTGVEAIAPELLARARAAVAATAGHVESERRLMVQLGGPEIRQRLPVVLSAMRCLPLFEKARAFGRATNGLQDDELVTAIQSIPRQDGAVAALLMMAAVGQVIAPSRLIVAATRIAGEATEESLRRAGFGPLLEALLAHAQNAIPPLLQVGSFIDTDLVCRAIERYHRLIRAISGYIELSRPGRTSTAIAALTKTVSERLAPKLREVPLNVNHSLRCATAATRWLSTRPSTSPGTGPARRSKCTSREISRRCAPIPPTPSSAPGSMPGSRWPKSASASNTRKSSDGPAPASKSASPQAEVSADRRCEVSSSDSSAAS